MSPIVKSALAVLLLAASACASRSGLETGPQTGSRDPNRITVQELAELSTGNAYEAVRLLRPNWLRARGQTSITIPEVVVYIDNIRMGGPENLNRVNSTSVATMEYIDALTAQQRFGLDHTNGAILVDTR